MQETQRAALQLLGCYQRAINALKQQHDPATLHAIALAEAKRITLNRVTIEERDSNTHEWSDKWTVRDVTEAINLPARHRPDGYQRRITRHDHETLIITYQQGTPHKIETTNP